MHETFLSLGAVWVGIPSREADPDDVQTYDARQEPRDIQWYSTVS
jgi:hypothetical protein